MFEWINPWISGGLSVLFFVIAIVLIIYDVRKDRIKGPIESYVFTRNNNEVVMIDIQQVGDKVEVVEIHSINT